MSRFNGIDSDGNRVIGIGLTQPTYSKMLQGEMMTVDLWKIGVPGVKLIIVAGRNEVEIAKHLEHTMNERTNVVVDPRMILQGGKS